MAILALLCPQASAADAQGLFSIAGEARFAQGADLEGSGFALVRAVQEGPLGLTDFQLHAGTVRVWKQANQYVYTQNGVLPQDAGVQVGHSNATYVLHNATITLVSEHGGRAHVGLDVPASSNLSFYASHAMTTLEARNRSVLSSDEGSISQPDRNAPYYYRAIDEEHILLKGPGRVHLSGPSSVKLYGMTVDIAADENTTRHTLAEVPEPLPYVSTVGQSWLVLEAEDFEIDLASTGAWQVALAEADLRWEGEALFRCIQGRLVTDTGSYLAPPRPIVLEGTFMGSMRPEGQGRAVHSLMDVSGELSATTMEAASGSAVSRGSPTLLPWLGLLVGLAATGAGAALVLRHRARPAREAPPGGPTAEECVDKADGCIHVEDFPEALRWITLARQLAPTSVTVCATQGFVLARLGRVEEALDAYLDASRLAPGDGEHALVAARLAHESGRPAEQVEDLLEVALARDPSQVEEVERDGFFDALAARPRFEHMVESAWRRFVADLSGPD